MTEKPPSTETYPTSYGRSAGAQGQSSERSGQQSGWTGQLEVGTPPRGAHAATSPANRGRSRTRNRSRTRQTRHRPRGRRWAGVLLTGLLVGIFAATATGAYGYYDAKRQLPDFGPTRCVGSEMTCIPRLKAAVVIGVLKAQGHSCRRSYDRWECALQVGTTKYTFALESVGGQVRSYSAQVSTGPRAIASAAEPIKPSKAAMRYLLWSAQLPYGYDSEFAAQIRNWLVRQVDSGGKTLANVGDYGYELDASQSNQIDLKVEAAVPE